MTSQGSSARRRAGIIHEELSWSVEVERLEFAAQELKVILTDLSCEQLFNDGDEVCQGADGG